MKKGEFPISPLVILILCLVFGVLAYLFIVVHLGIGQEESLAFYDLYLP